MSQTPTQYDVTVALPRADVFEGKHTIDNSILNAGQTFPIFDRTEYPEEGGIYVYFRGMPYPKKGFPIPEAVYANDLFKKYILSAIKAFSGWEMIPSFIVFALLPWRLKMRTINRALNSYAGIAGYLLMGWTLTEKRYSNPARTLRKIAKNFLLVLGANPETAEALSKAVATMLEYDDAYRYRVQDMASETRQMKLAIYPVTELRRLIKLYMAREKTHATGTLGAVMKIASIALLHPKVRRAWKVALTHITAEEFKWLQLDNADRYHVLIRGDYDFLGRTFDERCELYKDVHRRSLCCEAEVKPTEVKGQYICRKCFKVTEEAYVFPQFQEIAPDQTPLQK